MHDEMGMIYDQGGQARLMIFPDGRLMDFKGRSIGFLDSGSVYDYKGNHCGWYEEGILRDKSGDCVGFGDQIVDILHPLLPPKKIRSTPSLVEMEPKRPEIRINPPKLRQTANWSTLSPISLFSEP